MVEPFVKYVWSQLDVISQAPLAFGVCIFIVATIIWQALVWRYAGMLDSLEGRNKLQAEQIADYKNKLSGASPDEAKKRLDILESQLSALQPPRLTNEQKEKMTATLGGLVGNVAISHDVGASGVRAFVNDFASVFRAAGWGTSLPSVMGVGRPPKSGIALRVSDLRKMSPEELAVKNALELCGIPFDVQDGARFSNGIGSSIVNVELLLTEKS